MAKFNLDDLVKNEFYKIVNDAQIGITLNISQDDFSYVRFNYIEEGKLYGNHTCEEYLGNSEKSNEIYEAEYSNGTANYIPTLIVNDKEKFFSALIKIVEKYMSAYNFSKAIEIFGANSVIKNIILTIFSNARYVDYEQPIFYMNRYIDFFNDTNKLDNYIAGISLLVDSSIVTSTKKEEFGYETPYYFESALIKGNDKYYLPNISYGISNNKCYIYAIQNKHKNEDTSFNKKIKRNINKVNANVVNDADYDQKDTILGVPTNFVLALIIFLKTLKNNGIENIEVITFLPDRYFEKKASEEYDADLIQGNLTERLILLFYRIKNHINDMEMYYPIYDGISYSRDVGENLVIKLGDNIECSNNQLIEEILSKMTVVKKSNIR